MLLVAVGYRGDYDGYDDLLGSNIRIVRNIDSKVPTIADRRGKTEGLQDSHLLYGVHSM